jgi:hypothetical protein
MRHHQFRFFRMVGTDGQVVAQSREWCGAKQPWAGVGEKTNHTFVFKDTHCPQMRVQDIPATQRRDPLTQKKYDKYEAGIGRMCDFYRIPDETKEKLQKILDSCAEDQGTRPACSWTQTELDKLFLNESKLAAMRKTYEAVVEDEEAPQPKITPKVNKFYLVKPQTGKDLKKGQERYDVVQIKSLTTTVDGFLGCKCLYWVFNEVHPNLDGMIAGDMYAMTAQRDFARLDVLYYDALEHQLRDLAKGRIANTKRLHVLDGKEVKMWIEVWEDENGTYEHWDSDEEAEILPSPRSSSSSSSSSSCSSSCCSSSSKRAREGDA